MSFLAGYALRAWLALGEPRGELRPGGRRGAEVFQPSLEVDRRGDSAPRGLAEPGDVRYLLSSPEGRKGKLLAFGDFASLETVLGAVRGLARDADHLCPVPASKSYAERIGGPARECKTEPVDSQLGPKREGRVKAATCTRRARPTTPRCAAAFAPPAPELVASSAEQR